VHRVDLLRVGSFFSRLDLSGYRGISALRASPVIAARVPFARVLVAAGGIMRGVQPLVEALLQVSDRHWFAFEDPTRVLCAETPETVLNVLEDVEWVTQDRGLHAVGYLTYETGAA